MHWSHNTILIWLLLIYYFTHRLIEAMSKWYHLLRRFRTYYHKEGLAIRNTFVMRGSPSNWSRSTPDNPLYHREKIYCCPVWIHSNWSWFTPDNPLSHQREVSLLPCVDPQIIDLDLLLKSSLSSKGRFTTVMCGSQVTDLDPPLIFPSIIKGKNYYCHVWIPR